MSTVRAAAKTFDHKPLNIGPKPYGGSNNNNKAKPVKKPSFLAANENLPKGTKPVISANELSTFKLKSSKTPNGGPTPNGVSTDDKSELKNVNLKPPVQRQQEKDKTRAVNKTPPAVPKKPPTDDELKVKVVEDKSADQIKNEKERASLPTGSVRNSKLKLFEKLAAGEDEPPVRRRNTKSGGSFASNSSSEPGSPPKLSTFKKPQPVKKPDSLPRKLDPQTLSIHQQPILGPKPPKPIPAVRPLNPSSEPVIPTETALKSPVSPITKGPSPVAVPAPVAPFGGKAPQPQPVADAVEEELYDDVQGVAPAQQSQRVQIPSTQTESVNDEVIQDEIYDDVQDHPVAQQDELYDDVGSFPPPPPPSTVTQTPARPGQAPTPPVPLNRGPAPPAPISTASRVPPSMLNRNPLPAPIGQLPAPTGSGPAPEQGEEIYDDVGQAPVAEEIYDDVGGNELAQTGRPPIQPPSTLPIPKIDHAPIKTEKTFVKLPPEKFQIPYNLESWLKDILTANKNNLRNLDNNSLISPTTTTPNAIPLPQRTIGISSAAVDASNADVSTNNDDKKDKKKKEKEKKKQEKAEAKERQRRNKELSTFGLTLDILQSRLGGMYISSKDCSVKTKLHLSYKAGDELTMVEVAKQFRLKGKMVVQNNRDGKVGYVLKSDFGIPDDDPEEIEPEPEPVTPTLSTPSMNDVATSNVNMIETFDDEGDDIYDECGTALPPVVAAPPVPNTPRPQFAAQVPTEAGPGEEIYEEL
ncbi:uncharacterized protein [Clytia hemisphaerica]|uniref:Uncharacterized protein n=1 Tax=Clytia hemisphaerica TaxID=252671 RepID=A0A7M5WYP9_9CNID